MIMACCSLYSGAIKQFLCLSEWLEAGQVQRLVLVLTNVDTKEVMERWDFDIQCEAGFGPGSITELVELHDIF